jgi:SOS response regulatory protein OraA/RecX
MLMAGLFSWMGSIDGEVLQFGIIGCSLVGMTGIVVHAWRKVRQSENRTALVGMMVQRGMSAEQIERVMRTCQEAAEAGDAEVTEAGIIGAMKEGDYPAEDIERVLDAARTNGVFDAGSLKIIAALVEQGAEADEIENLLEARRIHPAVNRIAV